MITKHVKETQYELLAAEYDAAAETFISTAIRALMDAQEGLYSQVSHEPLSQLPDYSLPIPEDDNLRGRPIEAVGDATFDTTDVINGHFNILIAAIDRIANEMASQITAQILAHISQVCEATGNVISADVSYDSIAAALEEMTFSFDDEGNPNFSIVATPQTVEKIRALGEPTAEQKERIERVIARKRATWNAERNSRSLPSRRF